MIQGKKIKLMNLYLANKVVIVTGGASGIGEAISVALALEKAIPVIVDRNTAAIEKLSRRIKEIGGLVYGISAELTQDKECARVVELTIDRFGRIDGLINNAGDNDGVGLETGGYDAFMNSLHKNLIHYYLMAHYTLPYLKTAKGAIVNISSKIAETGQGRTSAYAAANGGRNALTREWAVELGSCQIRVNAVVVAESWTPLYQKKLAQLPDPAAMRNKISQCIPLDQRMTTPQEIADTVLFLLSNRSSHTTGQLIHVDGGYVHLNRTLSRDLLPASTDRSSFLENLKRLFR